MKHRYRLIKYPETIDCTGCKWLKYSLTGKAAPCRLCAGARLDSGMSYFVRKGRGKK